MSSRDITLPLKHDTRTLTSREVTLSGSPPFSDADCSVYITSEGKSGSLGGAAARSTTASYPEQQEDERLTGFSTVVQS